MGARRTRLALFAALACGVIAVAGVAVAAGRRHPPPRAGCTPLGAGTHRLPVQAGRTPVVLHIPPHLRVHGPLILALPGAGQTAGAFAGYTGYSRLADAEHVAVAYPTAAGTRPLWNITDNLPGRPLDVPYLRAVIGAVVHASCADAARVGVTGVSNGGGMSVRMACDATDVIAAAAPVAGSYGALPDCHPSRPVPILEIHGTGDQVVPYRGKGNPRRGDIASFLEQWRRLDGCRGTPAARGVAPGVTELRSTRCAGGTQVVHDRIAGEPHSWPGGARLNAPFSATLRTFRFLVSFRS